MNNKNLFLILLAAVIIAAGVYAYLTLGNRPKIETQEFRGTIEQINEDSLLVKGFYTSNGEIIQAAELPAQEILVQVTMDTEFEKTVTYLPSSGQAGDSFSYNDLRKETIPGSLEDIRELELLGSTVTVNSQTNVFGKSKITASKIHYAADVTDIQ